MDYDLLAIAPEYIDRWRVMRDAALNGQTAEPLAAGGFSARRAGTVAVLPLHGVISPRATIWTQIFGGVGLDQFSAALNAAAADPGIEEIVLDVDSPEPDRFDEFDLAGLEAFAALLR
jgi:ClpP class serine protease